jgi:hypothetical protein
MRKPTTDPDNVQLSDVLCDFCRQEWREDLPVVEGHQGSVICGPCLAAAYRSVLLNKESPAPSGSKCVMCLETRKEPAWQSAEHPDAAICKRCINQCAAVLAKDADYGWKKPTA